jgi:hypothetical protein
MSKFVLLAVLGSLLFCGCAGDKDEPVVVDPGVVTESSSELGPKGGGPVEGKRRPDFDSGFERPEGGSERTTDESGEFVRPDFDPWDFEGPEGGRPDLERPSEESGEFERPDFERPTDESGEFVRSEDFERPDFEIPSGELEYSDLIGPEEGEVLGPDVLPGGDSVGDEGPGRDPDEEFGGVPPEDVGEVASEGLDGVSPADDEIED